MCVFLHFLLFALNQEGEGVHANTTVVQLLLLVQTLSSPTHTNTYFKFLEKKDPKHW